MKSIYFEELHLVFNFQTETGNEKVIRNVKIIGDRIRTIDSTGNIGQELSFYFDTHEECQAECKSR